MYGQRQLCFVQFRLGEKSVPSCSLYGPSGIRVCLPLRKVLIATNVSTLAGFATFARFGVTGEGLVIAV